MSLRELLKIIVSAVIIINSCNFKEELNSAIAANKTSLELKDLNNLICWPAFTQSIPETFVPPVSHLNPLK